MASPRSAHPDKFVGWVFLNPAAKSSVEEAERRFRNPRWIGVKAHPFWHRYPVAALDDIAALCQDRGKPMLVHLGGGAQRGDFRRLPERFPRLKLPSQDLDRVLGGNFNSLAAA
jgi:uncharacterized protein